jgi:hypothetical protein
MGGMGQAVEHLLCKLKALEFKPQLHQKKKKKTPKSKDLLLIHVPFQPYPSFSVPQKSI